MRDRWFEQFFTDEVVAQHEADVLHEDYSRVTMYPVDGGFVVAAERESDRGM